MDEQLELWGTDPHKNLAQRNDASAEAGTAWGQRLFLSNYPVKEITETLDYTSPKTEKPARIENEWLQQSNIQFDLPRPLADMRIIFSNKAKDSLFVGYSKKDQFYIDRTKSGKTDFSDKFADRIMTAPAQFEDLSTTSISIFVDRSSIEFLWTAVFPL